MLSPLWSPLQGPRPRRRGGWRQQAEAEMREEGEAPGLMSRLMGRLLLNWCEGTRNGVQVQQHAADAQSDGLDHPMVRRFAQLGTGQHSHEGIMQLLDSCGLQGQIQSFPAETFTDMLLPSTWIHLLHKYHRYQFGMRIGAERTKLRRFWRDFLAEPANAEVARGHPAVRGLTLGELAVVVPLVVHTDAAPFTKTQSVSCISFGGLLSLGDAKLTRLLCCSSPKGDAFDDGPAWQHLMADFEELRTGIVAGRTVAADPDGTVWKFALIFCKGDEEVRCNTFGAAHYNAREEPCSECLANRDEGDKPFTDLREHAAWRPSENMGFEAYKARFRLPHHPVVASTFFCHRYFFMLDLMHLVDCGGVAALVFGSALMYLVRDARLGPNQDVRLAAINAARDAFYSTRPGLHKLPKIFLKSLRSNGWGDLHGPAFKAAIVRSAAPFIADLVATHCIGDEILDRSLRGVTAKLAEFYQILYDAPMFLAPASRARLQAVCLEFGLHYQRLRELSRRAGLLAFAVTPKVHKLQHVPMLAKSINPRFVQCYIEESIVGSVVGSYKGSVRGRYRPSVQRVVLVKRLAGLLLRLELDV